MTSRAPGISTVARRPSLAVGGALTCAAAALWVSFGALTFVEADNSAAYVGLLPSPLWLGLLLVAAGLLAIIVRPSARAVAPLWLSAVAILPWLPLPLPLSVFVWTGNLLLWLWAAIGLAMVATASGPPLRLTAFAKPMVVKKPDPTKSALAAGLLSAMAFGLGTWAVAPEHPDGDEPHYLIITQSILRDGDLKIENNHRQGDYLAYLDISIKPDFLKRGTDGQIYSIHAPGLPVILAPGFAILGYRGALIELILISAAACALVWLMAWRITGDATASWFGWAAFALSVPFFFHASAIFPDGLGAVLVLFAVLPLIDPRGREPRQLVIVGAALAVLPWLSSRFIVLAITAAVVIVLRLAAESSRRAARLAAFAICPVISGMAFFGFYQIIYGTPNPSVVYGGAPSMSLSASTLMRGVPGLFFDQQFGLITNAPVYLCAFAGLSVMLWGGSVRRLALELLVIAVPYFLIAASFTSWWGGTTPPARYFVPLTPLLALTAAYWFATAKTIALRTVSLFALLVSLLMTATMALVERGAFVFNFRDGMSRVALWLSPVVDLTKALPSLFQNPPSTVVLQTAVWLLAIASAVAAAAALNRRGRAAVILGFGLTLQATTMAAVSGVWRSNGATAVTAYPGGAEVLRRYSPDGSQLALAYRPFHRLERTELPARIILARTLSTSSRAESPVITHLPAGVYEVTGTALGPSTGHLRIRTDRVSGPIADWDIASFGSSWARQVAIPVPLAGLQIETDADARKTIRDVSVRAVSVSEPPAGLGRREARRAARYGPALVFLMAGDAWVEPTGTWVEGGSNAEFAIAPDSQSSFQLFLRNGRVANEVTLQSQAWRERMALKPGEERFVAIPPDGRGRVTPLTVSATTGFRPADFDPKTEDVRFLGIWIETR